MQPLPTTELAAAAARIDCMRLLYLFGSMAEGRARDDSDIDLGVVVEEQAAQGDRLGLLRLLLGRFGQAVASDRLDLVVLNDASPLLRFEVLKVGRLLWARIEAARTKFAFETIRDYQDSNYRRDFATAIRMRRLKEGPRSHGKPGDLLEATRRTRRLLAEACRVPGS